MTFNRAVTILRNMKQTTRIFLTVTVILVLVPAFLAAQEVRYDAIRYDSPVRVLPQNYRLVSPGMDSLQIRSGLSALHAFLGFATFGLGVTTGILNPEVVSEDIHGTIGTVAAGMAAATLAAGFAAHYDEIGPGFGFSSKNVHTLLGISGATMMMITPFIAPAEAHQALGMMGTGLMGLSIAWKLVF